MTPKSLLRLPAAASSLTDLIDDAFRPVLDDPTRPTDATRLVLCSGKLYYELLAGLPAEAHRPAIVRQELLYPYPADELRAVFARYPALQEVVWAQEEPRNMGAWSFVQERLSAAAAGGGDAPLRRSAGAREPGRGLSLGAYRGAGADCQGSGGVGGRRGGRAARRNVRTEGPAREPSLWPFLPRCAAAYAGSIGRSDAFRASSFSGSERCSP